MRIQLLLFGAIACGGTLFGTTYYDGMKDLLYAAAKTNVLALVGKQVSTNATAITGRLMDASVDGGFDNVTALTNTLRNALCPGNGNSATATTTTVTNSSSAVSNGQTSARPRDPGRSGSSRQRTPFRGRHKERRP